MAAIMIRGERPGDGPAISDVVRRTYADVAYSDHREHLMIERLRGTAAYVPALSLLAEIDGVAVGHILLTRAHIVADGRSPVATLALAPLSVVAGHRFAGVGKRLIDAARRRAIDLGFDSILLVGTPSYFPQFGFEPLARYPIMLPFAVPEDYRMILRLRPHALDGVAGMARYADGWLNH
jgi:predicted N-acetyltransferase YhbS